MPKAESAPSLPVVEKNVESNEDVCSSAPELTTQTLAVPSSGSSGVSNVVEDKSAITDTESPSIESSEAPALPGESETRVDPDFIFGTPPPTSAANVLEVLALDPTSMDHKITEDIESGATLQTDRDPAVELDSHCRQVPGNNGAVDDPVSRVRSRSDSAGDRVDEAEVNVASKVLESTVEELVKGELAVESGELVAESGELADENDFKAHSGTKTQELEGETRKTSPTENRDSRNGVASPNKSWGAKDVVSESGTEDVESRMDLESPIIGGDSSAFDEISIPSASKPGGAAIPLIRRSSAATSVDADPLTEESSSDTVTINGGDKSIRVVSPTEE
ncbi:hypothetical protein HDU93_005306 [Gonapodya sp. JEL0774]|nr:hypothetical protein HDU93_005306 [Gonapodya sp. JEL0774]